MEKNYSCVVDRLKEERIRLNYSQQQVAFCLGMTQSGYNRMEKGLNYLSDYELQCLCETDIDVDYVITGEKRHKEYSYEFERFEINELLDYIYLMCVFLTHEYNRDKAIQDSEEYKSIEMVRFLVRPYKGYENMVYAIRTLLQLSQQSYCEKLKDESRYNDLLLLENEIFAAFLYGKFQEFEKDSIKTVCCIHSRMGDCDTPVFYLVEMTGILLNNAADAVRENEYKVIYFSVETAEHGFAIKVSNRYRDVPYEEIEQWFQLDVSSKETRGRGVGLYHLLKLCNEWNYSIRCSQVEIEGNSGIEFVLENRASESE